MRQPKSFPNGANLADMEADEMNKLVVPQEMHAEVLELCNNIPSAGHQGIDRPKVGKSAVLLTGMACHAT